MSDSIEEIYKKRQDDIVMKKLEEILKKQGKSHSFFSILFVAITTLVTNLWAQYVYNNMVTNYGCGTHGWSDSLYMLFAFTILAIGIAILFALDVQTSLV
jgi:hypothetical protein